MTWKNGWNLASLILFGDGESEFMDIQLPVVSIQENVEKWDFADIQP